MEFEKFGKIPRLKREVIITEKIDGTNAQVVIDIDSNVFAGSRNRYLTVENDNFGFAAWVKHNEDDLRNLGTGRHYGEWYGQGIQRGYDLKEKRFALFNIGRWNEETPPPKCCTVVPSLDMMIGFEHNIISDVMDVLRENGSVAVPGYMKPEGIVLYHSQANQLFKFTFENDEKGKPE